MKRYSNKPNGVMIAVLAMSWAARLMTTLHQVYAGEELAVVQLVGEIKDAGEGVAVVCRCQVESGVVPAGPP